MGSNQMVLDDDPKFWQGYTQEQTHEFIDGLIEEAKKLDEEKMILVEALQKIITSDKESNYDIVRVVAEEAVTKGHIG